MPPRRAAAAAAPAETIYPVHGDPGFATKIKELKEYSPFLGPDLDHAEAAPAPMDIPTFNARVQSECKFEKAMYQQLVAHYLARRSPYRSLLLFHQLGTGKTCSAISIAEGLLSESAPSTGGSVGPDQRVWVVLSAALKDNFEANVFDPARVVMDDAALHAQCTGDLYKRMLYGWRGMDAETRQRKITALIRSRYRFFTYDGFAEEIRRIREAGGEGALRTELRGVLLIVDEAHNLRVEEADKKGAEALELFAKHGEDTRIVLLTATPMYNEASEILWLLAILTQNDRHPQALNPRRLPVLYPKKAAGAAGAEPGAAAAPVAVAATRAILAQLASEYISYIRGTNPFTFAARLSPRESGLPTLDAEWAAPIRDGLFTTPLGAEQVRAMGRMGKSDATLFQAANICYPSVDVRTFKVGREGFNRIFTETDTDRPIQVTYTHPEQMALYPDAEHLGKFGAKLMKVAELAASAEGVVVVYSQFVWGGVVPLAVVLEHLGMMRYGTRNILRGARIRPRAAGLPSAPPGATYAILTRDASVMGDTNIRQTLAAINAPENRDGRNVKVVLITPVAGEGISFQSVREVHVLDPWYHLNRLDQVIGRAIRKCSHTSLPVQQRNVTVFLHAATAPEADAAAAAATEAAPAVRLDIDTHAYQFAARKAAQVSEIETLLRDNATDCVFNREVNYFPRDRFGLTLPMRTSRGNEITWAIGDPPEMAPNCAAGTGTAIAPDVARGTLHRGLYASLIDTGIQRVRKMIAAAPENQVRFARDDVAAVIGLNQPAIVSDVLREAGVLHRLAPNMRLVRHRDGYVLYRGPGAAPEAVKIRLPEVAPISARPVTPKAAAAAAPLSPLETVLMQIPASASADTAALMTYQALDSENWPAFAKRVLEAEASGMLADGLRPAVAALRREGAFILPGEIRRGVRGYLDIFAAIKKPADIQAITVTVYDAQRRSYRDATDAERSELMSNRRIVTLPDPAAIQFVAGVMDPEKLTGKKAATAAAMGVTAEGVSRFIFKLWFPGPTVGARRGVVCESNRKPDLEKYLTDLGAAKPEPKLTKDQLCFSLATRMLSRNRLILYPLVKPAAGAAAAPGSGPSTSRAARGSSSSSSSGGGARRYKAKK